MRLGRPVAPIVLTTEEREMLERWARRPTTAQALALRARLVLRCAAGETATAIARDVHVRKQTVGKWRGRFLTRRLDGLLDEPRPGVPRTITDADVERILTTTLESTPRDATHWSTRSLAQQCDMSQTAIARIWKAFALQPHRVDTFKLSKDPLFIDKVRDIVGLYVHPPDRALLLSVDEKSQIQALDRTSPILPLRPGQPETAHARLRPTRYDLVVRGARCRDWPGHRRIAPTASQSRVPAVSQHDRRAGASRPRYSSDSRQLRHAQDATRSAMVCSSSALSRPLHADQRFVAESGRALVCDTDRETDQARRTSQHAGARSRDSGVSDPEQRVGQTLCLDQNR